MKSFWQILALLMLALMVPASTCCQWANVCGSQAECRCCTEDQHDDPAQPEACPSTTISHSQVPPQIVLPSMQMIELAEIIQKIISLNEMGVDTAPLPLTTTAPPELWTTWVFANRAALPARAPAEQV